jgi:hypothetical protein
MGGFEGAGGMVDSFNCRNRRRVARKHCQIATGRRRNMGRRAADAKAMRRNSAWLFFAVEHSPENAR